MKRLVTALLIAFSAATCVLNDANADPPRRRRDKGDSYSEHNHRPYYYRRYAPPDRGKQRERPPSRPH